MKKLLLISIFLIPSALLAQTHTFPATDTNNTFTGTNTFQADTTVQNLDILGTCTGCLSNPFAGDFSINGKLNVNADQSVTSGAVQTIDATAFNSNGTNYGLTFLTNSAIFNDLIHFKDTSGGIFNTDLQVNHHVFSINVDNGVGILQVSSSGLEYLNASSWFFRLPEFEIEQGIITHYGGTNNTNNSTAGKGIAVIRNSTDQTVEVTGDSGTVTLYTPAVGGVYRVSIYTVVSTNVATSTIQWTVGYTDIVGAQTTVGASIAGDTAGTHKGEEFIIQSTGGVAITASSTTANSPKYKYYIRLEAI